MTYIEGSKEFRKYQKTAGKKEERAQERADRRQVRVERVASIVDGINRYREQSRDEEREKEEEDRQEEERKRLLCAQMEQEIEDQVVRASDTEEEALAKMMKLGRLFHKCSVDSDYGSGLVSMVLRTIEDNVSIIEMSYPDKPVTAKAKEQLEQLKLKKKKDDRAGMVGCILILLGIIAFVLFCIFMDDIFPKK